MMWRNTENILLPRYEQGRLQRLLLFTIIMSLALFLVLTGRLMMVVILISLALSIWFAYRWPIFLAGIALILSLNIFQLVPMDALIKWQLGPGLRINLLDAILLLSLPLAILRLWKRKEKLLFVSPVFLILAVAFLNLGLGLAFGTTNLDYGMGFLRTIFYYTAYFILVSAMDSPQRLKQWMGFLYVIFLVSIGMQFYEVLTGQRLTLGLANYYVYSSDVRLMVGGYKVMYIWNRAALLTFLVLFLALGARFQSRQTKWFLLISSLGIGSVLLAFVRQWYVYTLIGILTLLMLQTKRRMRNIILVVFLIFFLFCLLIVISPVLRSAFGPSFIDAWSARFNSLVHFQTASNFLIRLQIIEKQWKMFLQSPLVGYGLSPVFGEMLSWDTGITNTLVQFGLLGLGAVLVLVVSFLRYALKIRRQIPPSVQQGYVLGLLGVWVCVIVGSLFSQNYFTRTDGIWMIVNMLALLDRFNKFAPRWAIQEN